MPNSWFSPSLIRGLRAIFPLIHSLCVFLRPLLTPRDSPFFASLSVHGLHFTVYAALEETIERCRNLLLTLFGRLLLCTRCVEIVFWRAGSGLEGH